MQAVESDIIKINTPYGTVGTVRKPTESEETLFTQYFVEAPLAAITAVSVLGYDATSLVFFSADPLKLCQVGWGALLHSYEHSGPQSGAKVHIPTGQRP